MATSSISSSAKTPSPDPKPALLERVFRCFQYRDFRVMWIGACTVRLYPVGEPASNRSPLPLFDAGLSDLLGQVVDHFSLVTRHFKVGGAQKLVLAVEQGFTNALLHPRVAQGALAGWFAREDLEHTVAAVGLDNRRDLPRRNTENSSHVGAGLFERRLGHKTE